jgi:hypothetical protein
LNAKKAEPKPIHEFGLNVTVKQWGRKGLNVGFPPLTHDPFPFYELNTDYPLQSLERCALLYTFQNCTKAITVACSPMTATRPSMKSGDYIY